MDSCYRVLGRLSGTVFIWSVWLVALEADDDDSPGQRRSAEVLDQGTSFFYTVTPRD